MADGVLFAIGGTQVRCPDLQRSTFEPGGLEDAYLDGSLHYFGMSSWTFVWPYITDAEVAVIRSLYDTLIATDVTAIPSLAVTTVTVPDISSAGGWKTVHAFMGEPTGTAGGDGSKDFTVPFRNIGIDSLYTAMSAPKGNHKTALNNGITLVFGQSEYPSTGCPF